MTSTDIAKSDLVYNGEIIHLSAETISLTDMWRARGSDLSKQPAKWRELPSTKEFCRHVAEVILRKSEDEVFVTRRGGKAPGTWAHWQIAMNYARYLDPGFASWCNDEIRQRMEGRAIATAKSLTPYDLDIIGNMIKKCTGVTLEERLPGLLAPILAQMMPMVAHAYMAQNQLMMRHGKTANQILLSHGFPAGVKNFATWLGNRLDDMGCRMNGTDRAESGTTAIRMFDPDKADAWMRNGGKIIVSHKLAERQGQKILRFVPRHRDSEVETVVGEGA